MRDRIHLEWFAMNLQMFFKGFCASSPELLMLHPNMAIVTLLIFVLIPSVITLAHVVIALLDLE